MIYALFNNNIKRKGQVASERKKTGVLTVICKLLFIYNQNLNAYAKVSGIRLLNSGVTKRMLQQLSQTYDSVTYNTTQSLFQRFAEEAELRVNVWNKDVVHCGDNVDIRKTARHALAGKSTCSYDFHTYNNMLFKLRVDISSLSDPPPTPPDAQTVDYGKFLPSVEDQSTIKELLTQTVNSIISDTPSPPQFHEYSPEMLKTEKVS